MAENSSSSSAASQQPGSPGKRDIDRRSYWRHNLMLIGVLLLIWAGVSYGCSIVWVEYLNQFYIGHLPLGFWFAQQGSMYTFVILIFVYAFAMDRLDRRYGVQE
ncbi:MAG: DUF4212 domain-containing protein [Planctomycetales bacterium]|nr:DUF4212 domain-containing protein [Planctomycetales bacterium]